jgi:transglutaminase-like putative cysteine protease
VIYDIKLRIAYVYDNPAVGGRHVVCVMPLDPDAHQRCLSGTLEITPLPEERLDRRDFFGNQVTEFSFREPHDSIALFMKARVERDAVPDQTSASTFLSDLPTSLAQCRDLGPDSPLHFTSPSVRVPADDGITAFARNSAGPGMTAEQVVLSFGRALHHHMRFDAKATTVDTPATEAFANRKGVCQDFSHIMIAGLRGLGIPAGYVSGFLRTHPPPGKPRLEGADAMHAWVRAWCGPDFGWMEFDPTNDKIAGVDHILVARGRDYSDVAPIRGRLRISGRQKSHQSVDVVPTSD